tara:strand:+ start:382 stop:558 length:177 start_codon:yes stop_codon:yes gene_type:complete
LNRRRLACLTERADNEIGYSLLVTAMPQFKNQIGVGSRLATASVLKGQINISTQCMDN